MDKFAKRSDIDLKSKAALDPSEILRRKVSPSRVKSLRSSYTGL